MNISYEWIKQFCDVTAEPHEFAARMTMSGSKVEGYENYADSVKNVVVCKILSVEKHPDADKLKVCSVDIGGETRQIVTAATNVAAGDTVPVALHHSLLPNGEKIEKGKLRGVLSEGMFCSIAELCVTLNDFPECIENGIMQLPGDIPAGTPIADALHFNDYIFEFEITPNRPDCLCASGLAREAAATFGVPFNFPAPLQREKSGQAEKLLSAEILDAALCRRYSAAIVKNVKVAPSPLWMRTRLRGAGVRPINNIVDITNYVMLEYNQPMHAFDLKNVSDGKIIVRRAKQGESITTLDDVKRELTPEMLVIADSQKPIAVAGVMGGEFSGIYPDTNAIVFESANFEGINNRATSKALGLRTDASVRYEKGLDPNNTLPALMRALELVELLGAGEVVSGYVDCIGNIPAEKTIPLNPAQVNAFLGTDIPTADMLHTLRSLEFKVDDKMNVTPPSFRGDIEAFADVAEEIARFYGYDKIPTTVMSGVAAGRLTPRQSFDIKLARLCVAGGFYEACTLTFMNPKALQLMNVPADSPLRNAVKIANPFGEETSLLRTSAASSMLDMLANNFKARRSDVRLFELAVEFTPNPDTNELPYEKPRLVLAGWGNIDFYALKGAVENICERLRLPAAEYTALTDDVLYHPGRAALITCGERVLGRMGELHPAVAKNYGIKTRAVLAVLDADALFELRTPLRIYKGMPKFPALERDLALVCGEDTEAGALEKVIAKSCGALLESISVFDVYRGDQLPEGKKSIAYKLILRAADRTLTDTEADRAVSDALGELEKSGVTLRA